MLHTQCLPIWHLQSSQQIYLMSLPTVQLVVMKQSRQLHQIKRTYNNQIQC